MAFTIKNLAEGQLGIAAAGDLYTVPANTKAIVKTITVVNTDTAARTVNVYYRKSGAAASRRLLPKDFSVPAGGLVETNQEYTLGASDKIQGDSSVAAVVDFTLSGIEES